MKKWPEDESPVNFKDLNKFEQLIDDLNNLKLIRTAIRVNLKQRKDIPEAIKNLIDPNIVDVIFNLFEQMLGSLELAYRRGVQVGIEKYEKENKTLKPGDS